MKKDMHFSSSVFNTLTATFLLLAVSACQKNSDVELGSIKNQHMI